MALPACVKVILCGLAKPVLIALVQIINSQIAVVQTELLAAQAALTVTQIATAPVKVLAALAQQEIAEAQSVSNLVPVQVMTGCGAFGGFMTDINASLQAATAGARNLEGRLNRLLGRAVELKFLMTQLQGIVDDLNSLKGAIEDALIPGSCP